jgi:hypothetical protein
MGALDRVTATIFLTSVLQSHIIEFLIVMTEHVYPIELSDKTVCLLNRVSLQLHFLNAQRMHMFRQVVETTEVMFKLRSM